VKTTSSVEINRPVEEVWRFFDNPDNMPLWLEGFKRFEPLSGKQGQVGAKSKHVYEVGGRTFEMIEEITKRDPPREFSGILSNKMMTSTMVNSFEDLGNGKTALRSTVETRFTSPLYRLLGPMMKGGFQKRQDADLARLKKALER
jgi:uncharacterized protein YndB with AHSA1/START domain